MNAVSTLCPSRDQLIETNIQMVDAIVGCLLRRNPRPGIERDDLIQEGRIGLIRAADTFDTTRNVLFRTWATACIVNAIREAIRAASRTVDTVALTDDTFDQSKTLSPSPDAALTESEARIVAAQLLPRLPESQRRAIDLFYIQNLSKSEIARTMNISRVHAGRLVESGLQMLRDLASEGNS